MKNIQEQLLRFFKKYASHVSLITSNMRLVLLVLFGILSGYLVLRVNNLVSDKPIVDVTISDISSKKPDKDVISVFNELQSQDVEINSQFVSDRNNPF